MKITFYAHASFRLETPTVSVVTDPYTPGPRGAGFAPIDEAADLVVMSSSTDRFHADPSHVRGAPIILDALDLPPEGTTVRGVSIVPFPAMESLSFDFRRDPDANAMSLITIGGVRVLHMGDAGNPVPRAHLDALKGRVDVLLALAVAHATIALDDLDDAIAAIAPRIVIPMHYWSARGVLKIEPVDRFLARQPAASTVRLDASSLEIDPTALPAERQVVVLQESR